MKRDDDFIRALLLAYEEEDDWLILIPGETKGASSEEWRERGHILIMMDEGLLDRVGNGTMRITAAGHDYLNAIRSDGIWDKTKAAVAQTGGSATIELLKALATGFVKKKIQEHTGVDL